MSTEKVGHTPGPWTLDTVPTSIGSCHRIGPFPANGVHDENHACIYADGIYPHNAGDESAQELLANARLIAAAPDLLEAARMALSFVDGTDRLRPDDEPVALLRAAIARAEGIGR